MYNLKRIQGEMHLEFCFKNGTSKNFILNFENVDLSKKSCLHFEFKIGRPFRTFQHFLPKLFGFANVCDLRPIDETAALKVDFPKRCPSLLRHQMRMAASA